MKKITKAVFGAFIIYCLQAGIKGIVFFCTSTFDVQKYNNCYWLIAIIIFLIFLFSGTSSKKKKPSENNMKIRFIQKDDKSENKKNK